MATRESALCGYLASLEQGEFSARTRHRVALALLDWFTAGWSGAAMKGAERLRGLSRMLFPGDASAPVFGTDLWLTPLGAAFCNAGIAHLREIDDAHRTAMLHPGIVAISPVLAMAGTVRMTRRRFTAAIAAGYEMAIRAGEALGAEHSTKFHATATAGTLGAAAASAVALGSNAETLHDALGIAATQAAGLWQFMDDGAQDSKVLHPAMAVRNGMTAAYAAQSGYPGARAFMTGPRGMHALLHGNGPLQRLDEDLGLDELINTTTSKPWPACAQLFTPIGATAALIERHAIDPAHIESVVVSIFPQALRIACVDWPSKPSETCFSARYCVAILLLTRQLGIKEVEAPDFNRSGLNELAARIRVHAEPKYASAYPQRRPCTVIITMKNGQVLTATQEIRRGDPEDPLDWDQMVARMQSFAPTLTEQRAREIASWCSEQALADDARELVPPPAFVYR
jgi:2-methylcitrate dehydratase PrpD